MNPPPNADRIRICASSDLVDGGLAVIFDAPLSAGTTPALVVRWRGAVCGYINRCAHAAFPLDWKGRVLEKSGRFIMCPKHGAIYEPDSGRCVGGPCTGGTLTALDVQEHDGSVWLVLSKRHDS